MCYRTSALRRIIEAVFSSQSRLNINLRDAENISDHYSWDNESQPLVTRKPRAQHWEYHLRALFCVRKPHHVRNQANVGSTVFQVQQKVHLETHSYQKAEPGETKDAD